MTSPGSFALRSNQEFVRLLCHQSQQYFMMIIMVNRADFVVRIGIVLSSIMTDNIIVSSISFANQASTSSTSCAVVGVGVLGTSLCRQILQDSSLAHFQVTGITKTNQRHTAIFQDVLTNAYVDDDNDDDITRNRFELRTCDEVVETKFDNVVFCAPPSGFDDYPKAVQEAAESLWAGPEAGGVFLFTSSGAV